MSSADSGEDNNAVAAIALVMCAAAGYFAIYNIVSLFHACTLARKYRKDGTVVVGRVITGEDLFDEYDGLWFQQNDLASSGKSTTDDITIWNRALTVDYTAVHGGEIQTFRKRFPGLAFKTVRNSLRQGEVELYTLPSEGATSAYPRLEFHLSIKERAKRQFFRLGMTVLFLLGMKLAATSGGSGFVSTGLPVVLALDVILVVMKYVSYRNHILNGGKALKSNFRSSFKREQTSRRDVEWPSAQPQASEKGWTFGIYKPVATSDPDKKSDRAVVKPKRSMSPETRPDVEAPPRSISEMLFGGTSSGPFEVEPSAPPLTQTSVAINFDSPETEKKKKKKKKRSSSKSRSSHSRSSVDSESPEERRKPPRRTKSSSGSELVGERTRKPPPRTKSMPMDRKSLFSSFRSGSDHNTPDDSRSRTRSPVRVSRSSVSSSRRARSTERGDAAKSPTRSKSLVRTTRASLGGIASSLARPKRSGSLDRFLIGTSTSKDKKRSSSSSSLKKSSSHHLRSESLKSASSRKSRSSVSSSSDAVSPDSPGSKRRSHSPTRGNSGASSSGRKTPGRTNSDSSTKSKERRMRHSTIL